MFEKTVNVRLRQITGTSENLSTKIPLLGELVYETDSKAFKIGDGSSQIQSITPLGYNGIYVIKKTLIVTTEWQNTGIYGQNLPTGSYIINVSGMSSDATSMWYESYTGIMEWYSGGTNSSEANEILLHYSGHAPNGRCLYLRTVRSANTAEISSLRLQIASSVSLKQDQYTFKFKRLM